MCRWFALWEILRVENELDREGELVGFLADQGLDPVSLAWAVGFALDFHRTCPSA